uniref:Uncharacterized protein n=1 Tax=Schistocephalus solidus TaxID=70667 RepID=A0A0X3NMA3_SCHSO
MALASTVRKICATPVARPSANSSKFLKCSNFVAPCPEIVKAPATVKTTLYMATAVATIATKTTPTLAKPVMRALEAHLRSSHSITRFYSSPNHAMESVPPPFFLSTPLPLLPVHKGQLPGLVRILRSSTRKFCGAICGAGWLPADSAWPCLSWRSKRLWVVCVCVCVCVSLHTNVLATVIRWTCFIAFCALRLRTYFPLPPSSWFIPHFPCC